MSQRSQAQFNRITSIIVISFFLYVIISTLVLLNIDEGEFASRPVYENLFGRSFVVGHLGAVSGLIFLFATIIILNKTGDIKPPFRYYQEIEKKIFYNKYNFLCKDSVERSKRIFFLGLAVFSTFLPAIIPLSAWLLFGVEDYTIPALIGIILMFTGFYKSIFSVMNKGEKRIHEFFQRVNKTFPNTEISVKKYGIGSSVLSNQFSILIDGIFKGRKIFAENSSAGHTLFRYIKVTSQTNINIEIKSRAVISIKKDYVSRKEGSVFNLPEIILSGESHHLSEAFKELVGNYDRPLNLEIKNNLLAYKAKDFDIIPFYTIEGIILFLELLLGLAEEIEKSPYV